MCEVQSQALLGHAGHPVRSCAWVAPALILFGCRATWYSASKPHQMPPNTATNTPPAITITNPPPVVVTNSPPVLVTNPPPVIAATNPPTQLPGTNGPAESYVAPASVSVV